MCLLVWKSSDSENDWNHFAKDQQPRSHPLACEFLIIVAKKQKWEWKKFHFKLKNSSDRDNYKKCPLTEVSNKRCQKNLKLNHHSHSFFENKSNLKVEIIKFEQKQNHDWIKTDLSKPLNSNLPTQSRARRTQHGRNVFLHRLVSVFEIKNPKNTVANTMLKLCFRQRKKYK